MGRVFFLSCILIMQATDPLVKPNELAFVRFSLEDGRNVAVVRDSANRYIAYRITKDGNVQLEFPARKAGSWKQFTYSYYLRGGGPENEGLDLNYVSFTNGNYRYTVYETYAASGDKTDVGVEVKDLKKNTVTKFPGVGSTRQGTLIGFRDSELIERREGTP